MNRAFLSIPPLWLPRLIAASILLFGIVLASWPAIAGEQTQGLGSDQFAERQAAMQRLWASREAAEKAVEAAERAGDAEMATRARWILDQWNLGLTPQTPPELRRTLRAASQTTDPEELVELFLQGVPEPLLQRIRRNDPLAMVAGSEILEQYWLRASVVLMQSGDSAALVELLDRCALKPSHAMLRYELLRHQGKSPEQCLQLPESARQWSVLDRQKAELWLLELTGDFETLAAKSLQYGLPRVLAASLAKNNMWEQLAEFSKQVAQDPKTAAEDVTVWWTLTLAAARQADRGDIYDEALRFLQEVFPESSGAKEASVGLILAGDITRALPLMQESEFETINFLLSQQNYPLAFEKLGMHPHSVEVDLRRMAELADQSAKKLRQRGEGFAEVESVLATWKRALIGAKLAYLVGFRHDSHAVFKRLAAVPAVAGQPGIKMVLDEMPATTAEWQIEFLLPRLTAGDTSMLELLVGGLGNTAGLIWKCLSEMLPHEAAAARVRALQALAEGKLPDGWTLHGLPDKLAETAERIMENMPARKAEQEFRGAEERLARMFVEIGRTELASRFRVQQDHTESYAMNAQLAFDQGEYQQAAEYFRSDFSLHPSGDAESLVGWTVALRRSGAIEQADALDRVIDSLPLAYEQQNQLAKAFKKFNLKVSAQKHARESWRVTEPASGEGLLNAYENSRQAHLDPEEWSQWCWRVVFSNLVLLKQPDSGIRPLYWQVQRFAVLGAIKAGLAAAKQGDIEVAQRWLLYTQQLAPNEVDIAEQVAPILREQGHGALADKLVKVIVEHFERHLQIFPHDPTVSNNLAWVLALNDMQLERAKQLSLRAVGWVPDSTAYRDTLAETLFRAGDWQQAVRIERDCLIDTPDDWHLHKQIRRFSSQSVE